MQWLCNLLCTLIHNFEGNIYVYVLIPMGVLYSINVNVSSSLLLFIIKNMYT